MGIDVPPNALEAMNASRDALASPRRHGENNRRQGSVQAEDSSRGSRAASRRRNAVPREMQWGLNPYTLARLYERLLGGMCGSSHFSAHQSPPP